MNKPFQIIFECDELLQKWEVYAQGAISPLEAIQGFNAVIITAQYATPSIKTNKAELMSDGRYKISVGIIEQVNN